jgi:MFS family permease
VRHGVGPLLSIFLRSSLQWDAARIGLALSLVEFSAFMTQIPAGLLADASRSKRIIIAIACCLIVLGCSLIVFYPLFSTILFAQAMMGISISLISPALGAITLGLFGRKKFASRIAKNEMWNHAGNVGTALAAGLAGYFFGNIWIFYFVILFSFLSMAALSFIRPNEISYKAARELGEIDPITKMEPVEPISLLKLVGRKAIIIFNISLILYYMANGSQMALVGQILSNKDPKHSALFISACMIIAEMTMIGVAYTMSRIVNRYGRKTFLLTAFMILPIRATLYTLVENPFLFLTIQILDGLAAGILGVISGVINSDLGVGTGRFNFLLGMSALSTSLGVSISFVCAGFVAKTFGFDIGFLCLAAIGLIGAAFFWLLMPETKST